MNRTRVWIDTEFNGYQGELISIGLADDNGRTFYSVLACHQPVEWVAANVMPRLGQATVSLEMLQHQLQAWLAPCEAVHLIADWPDDIAHFMRLLITGPGRRLEAPPITMEIVYGLGETDEISTLPHNAIADAVGLKTAHLKRLGEPAREGPMPASFEAWLAVNYRSWPRSHAVRQMREAWDGAIGAAAACRAPVFPLFSADHKLLPEVRQELGEALQERLLNMAPEPDWHDSREIEHVIDGVEGVLGRELERAHEEATLSAAAGSKDCSSRPDLQDEMGGTLKSEAGETVSWNAARNTFEKKDGHGNT